MKINLHDIANTGIYFGEFPPSAISTPPYIVGAGVAEINLHDIANTGIYFGEFPPSAALDDIPEQFTLGDNVVGAALGVIVIRSFVVSGIDTETTFVATGDAEVSFDSPANWGSSFTTGVVGTGYVRLIASDTNLTVVSGGVEAGGIEDTFSISTVGSSYNPQGGDISGGIGFTAKSKQYPLYYGGIIDGGIGLTVKSKQYPPQGGDISGGIGFTSRSTRFTPQGGDISGGVSATHKSNYYLPLGGDSSGGGYALTYKVLHYLPVGGDAVGGANTPYNFIEFLPLVRMPTRVGGVFRKYRSVFDITNLIFQRYLPAYLNNNNDLVTPEGVNVEVTGDLQPIDTGSKAQLEPPSGYTLTGGWKFSSKDILNTLDDASATRSDTVEIGGRTYYVWRSLDWKSGPLATDKYIQYFLIMKRLPNGG